MSGRFFREGGDFGIRSTPGGLTPGVIGLMVLTTVALIVQSLLWGRGIILVLVPQLLIRRLAIYQPVTAVLTAPSPVQWLFGLLLIYFFGTTLERSLGSKRFFLYYFVVGTLSSLLAAALTFPFGLGGTVVVTSRSLFALLIGGFAALMWNETVNINFVLMRGKTLVLVEAGIELVFLICGYTDSIGALCGLGLAVCYFRRTHVRVYRILTARVQERLRLWRIRRKYRNLKVVDSDVRKMWDELEERLNKDDGNDRIH